MPRRIWIDRAIQCAVGTGVMLLPAAGAVPAIVGLHIAANLETDVGAWNVIKAFTVERTDFHVLDGLGLHRQIGCLRATDCGQRSGGAEKHTLRDCHAMSPQMCV